MEHTPPGFRFAAKLPKEITHEHHLHDSAPVLHRFLDAMSPLGEKLGPVLVQERGKPRRAVRLGTSARETASNMSCQPGS